MTKLRLLTLLFLLISVLAHAEHIHPLSDEFHLFPNQGVDFNIVEVSSGKDDFGDPSFIEIAQFFFDGEGTGLPENTWSSGDIIQFTVGGTSTIYEFDSPSNITVSNSTHIRDENPPFSSVPFGFSLGSLAGDGVSIRGFTLSSSIGFNFEVTNEMFANRGPIYSLVVPEPSTGVLVLLSFVVILVFKTKNRARTRDGEYLPLPK